jgi:NAD(P)H-flavin reductase
VSAPLPARAPFAAEPSIAARWPDNPYQPLPARIVRVERLTADTRLFTLAPAEPLGHRPGQFVMLSVAGTGEAPISVSSSPTRPQTIELCVRRVGRVTDALHRLSPGAVVGVRGPYGNGFPLEALEGHDLLLVAGGLGMAPLRSLLVHALDRRERFGRLVLMYGARSPAEILFRDEVEALCGRADITCLLTVDRVPSPARAGAEAGPTTRAEGRWDHHVGLLPRLFDGVEVDPARTHAAICGPPIVYRFVVERLLALGFSKDRILMSLERRMKCGVGKCGHCSIGYEYTCLHGPIFTYWDAINLPEVI